MSMCMNCTLKCQRLYWNRVDSDVVVPKWLRLALTKLNRAKLALAHHVIVTAPISYRTLHSLFPKVSLQPMY